MRPIFLIGYMGCGKTTLGRALAGATGLELIDLDEYIEQKAGMTIDRIFGEHGEEAFRAMEREALAAVATREDVIIACGGGTPCRDGMMDLMNSAGLTVWLRASLPVLHRRLCEGRATRPLIASISSDDALMDFIRVNLEKRSPFYSRAGACFDSSRLESEAEIEDSVNRFVSTLLELE